ncbi:MAG: hypothetical protein NVSMB64_11680 [Candidatus Velthaea sp.]
MAAFRQFADTLPIMVWHQSPAGEITFTNAAWFEVTQLPRDPSSYAPAAWSRIVHPDDFARISGTMREAVEEQRAYAFEYRARPAGGDDESYRWYYASATLQYINGVFAGWLGSIVDIQETRSREDAERRLREEASRRENEFKALGEAVPQILWTADASGAIDWYNHGWYDYTGQSAQEAAGWGWQAVHHPQDFPDVMKRWPEAIATGEKFQMEFRLRGRDGAFRWFLTLINPYKDEHGRVVRWFGTNTDIHEQKQNVERSKRIAYTLQEVFLPEHLPVSPLLAFDAVYMPAESDALVGGDWYDAFTLDDGRVAVSIGDVAGHGLDAAVIAGRLRHTIFAEALDNSDPAAVLAKADRVLRAQTDTMATALVAFIDTETGEFVYASAGHPTPIVAAPGQEAAFLEDGSAPLGTGFVDGGLATETHQYQMVPESLLLFYTDGVTEFSRDILSGRAQLLRAAEAMIAGELPMSARMLVGRVLDEHPTADDIAILLARWKPAAASTPLREAPLSKQWRFHSSHAYSARTSRYELMSFMREHAADDENLYASEIIIGELLANTVEHAPGLVEIAIDWTGECPLLTIRDAGPGFKMTAAHLPNSNFSEDGRGLYLVRSLSQRVSIKAAQGFGSELEVVLPISRTLDLK